MFATKLQPDVIGGVPKLNILRTKKQLSFDDDLSLLVAVCGIKILQSPWSYPCKDLKLLKFTAVTFVRPGSIAERLSRLLHK